MTIGILGAMPEEIDIIREMMLNPVMVQHGSREYHCGKIHGMDVVLVFSRWGKVAASSCVTALITEFNVERVVFLGVAGAVAGHLNIGDVVVSEKLYQHDLNASPLFNKHEIPLLGITFVEADSVMAACAYSSATDFLNNIEKVIAEGSRQEFFISSPKCELGIIASGDQFVSGADAANVILTDQPETLVVEMEGAAVAQVCHEYAIPFVVIRTVSDRANDSAHIDFPKFIQEVAQLYSQSIVFMFLEKWAASEAVKI